MLQLHTWSCIPLDRLTGSNSHSGPARHASLMQSMSVLSAEVPAQALPLTVTPLHVFTTAGPGNRELPFSVSALNSLHPVRVDALCVHETRRCMASMHVFCICAPFYSPLLSCTATSRPWRTHVSPPSVSAVDARRKCFSFAVCGGAWVSVSRQRSGMLVAASLRVSPAAQLAAQHSSTAEQSSSALYTIQHSVSYTAGWHVITAAGGGSAPARGEGPIQSACSSLGSSKAATLGSFRLLTACDVTGAAGQNIRKLVKDGFVIKKPTKIHSRSRAREAQLAKSKGRHSGYGAQLQMHHGNPVPRPCLIPSAPPHPGRVCVQTRNSKPRLSHPL